jgi:outer membrane protein assembly factor BamB
MAKMNPFTIIKTTLLATLIGLVLSLFFHVYPLIKNIQADAMIKPDGQDFFVVKGAETMQAPTSLPAVTSVYRNGPSRSGFYKINNIPNPLKISWKLENLFAGIHTASKATPAVDTSGIYFGTDTGIFYKFSLDGKKQWSFQTESGQQGIHGTALLDETFVYFGNYGGHFYCLKKETGELVWSTSVASAVGSSAFVDQNKIIFAAEFSRPLQGFTVALDRQTGRKIWVSEYFDEQVHSSPTLDKSNSVIAVGSNIGALWGLDLETGHTLWKTLTEGPIKGTAVAADGQFCFTSWDKKFRCVFSNNGRENFSVSLQGLSQSSPALDEFHQMVYVSSSAGDIFKISLKEKKIIMQRSLKMTGVSNRYSMPSPVLLSSSSGLFLLSPCEDSKVCLFDSADLSLRQKIEVGGFVSGSFAIFEGAVFFNVDASGLFRLN